MRCYMGTWWGGCKESDGEDKSLGTLSHMIILLRVYEISHMIKMWIITCIILFIQIIFRQLKDGEKDEKEVKELGPVDSRPVPTHPLGREGDSQNREGWLNDVLPFAEGIVRDKKEEDEEEEIEDECSLSLFRSRGTFPVGGEERTLSALLELILEEKENVTPFGNKLPRTLEPDSRLSNLFCLPLFSFSFSFSISSLFLFCDGDIDESKFCFFTIFERKPLSELVSKMTAVSAVPVLVKECSNKSKECSVGMLSPIKLSLPDVKIGILNKIGN